MPGYQPHQRSRWTLPLIVGGHVAVLGALALFKMAPPVTPEVKPIIAREIPLDQPPPPDVPPPEPRADQKPQQTPSVPDILRTPLPSDNTLPPRPMPPVPAPPIPFPDVPLGNSVVPPPAPLPAPEPPVPQPKPAPVRAEAERDPRYADAFQPPYPVAMQVRGEEGRAVVRVLIGTDGRVRQVEAVSATDPAFMSATTRHARARWRFRPATVDGEPVESWKRITVTFTLND